jgi:hypothetical protein
LPNPGNQGLRIMGGRERSTHQHGGTSRAHPVSRRRDRGDLDQREPAHVAFEWPKENPGPESILGQHIERTVVLATEANVQQQIARKTPSVPREPIFKSARRQLERFDVTSGGIKIQQEVRRIPRRHFHEVLDQANALR